MSNKTPSKRARSLGVAGLLAIATFMGYLVVRGQSRVLASSVTPEAPSRETSSVSADSQLKVVAYYFHVTVRCVTCRTIEGHSREAVEQGFPKELKAGEVEWRPVNVQLPENRHFIRDYQLYTRSLVLAKIRDGKQVEWRNLDKVWELVGRKGEFLKYVQSNVRAYLGDS